MKNFLFKCLFCFLTSITFANEDCPEANTSVSGEILLQAAAGKAGLSGKQLLADIKKAALKDCQERPYVYVFKKLNKENDNVSEFLEIFNDTILLKVEKITPDTINRELSEDELKLYPKNKVKKRISEYYDIQPYTIYYIIDTIYHDTIWTEEIMKRGYLNKWNSGKPFFSDFSLDEFSKRQWLFEKKYEEYYGFRPDEVSFVSKKDLILKLQGKNFGDQITTLLSYADKNKIGIYYYESKDKTPYALVVAKRKYAKYISGKFFNE
jgi:hypothetical protein